MIGFLSGEGACGHCPLSILCLLGKPLVIDKKVGDTYLGEDYLFHKKRVQFNDLNVQFCPRCFCVHFAIRHERYLCGILRTGVMTSGYKQGQGPVYHAIGMDGARRHNVTAIGCSRDANGQRRRCHPLSFEAGVRKQRLAVLGDKDDVWIDEGGKVIETDPYDCFDEFKKMLTEIH